MKYRVQRELLQFDDPRSEAGACLPPAIWMEVAVSGEPNRDRRVTEVYDPPQRTAQSAGMVRCRQDDDGRDGLLPAPARKGNGLSSGSASSALEDVYVLGIHPKGHEDPCRPSGRTLVLHASSSELMRDAWDRWVENHNVIHCAA